MVSRILIQLDTDPLPSTFDRVVAVDAGVEQLFSYGGVTPENVEPLVHGAMFTRKSTDLKSTAIFIGGGNVAAGEALCDRVLSTFFGPVRVSVMMDSNGSNTTAAATVLAAARHVDLAQATALVLGGTGPVGLRAAQILLGQGASVRLASRTLDRAEQMAAQLRAKKLGPKADPTRLTACETTSSEGLAAALQGIDVLIAAGAAGVELLSAEQWRAIPTLRVAIDLNAVPPVGLGGIGMTDKAVDHHGVICYGALGVGGSKMKIHTAALQRLFERHDAVLDTAAIFEIGQQLK